ncbi:hypothetical protein [Sediminibacter sp. Hel_I_10]|uniref:hypothetical protein n=1 Tax=Sediminibacter sp. Hel_I_10 TaxID=1392490 RepID=UPI00047DBE5F|nr:hypothetical protein [Sediminibacter sp. Hel_I_10]
MRKITNNNSIEENYNFLEDIIDSHISELLKDRIKNQQKILEICHLGKFLIFFNGDLNISQISEKPDFILNDGKIKIGLEHQIIVDFKPKEREGFFKNIFDRAEELLKADNTLPNFLANCYIKPYVNFKINQKEELIETVRVIIKEYVLNNNLPDNPIIDRITHTPHSQKSVSSNLGAWWRKDISAKIVEKAVGKKEKKLVNYRKTGILEQWLLLVIGSTGESSYDMNKDFEMELKTNFNRVYILEDFYNNLYQLK